MQKDNIIINSIEKVFQVIEYVALPSKKKMIAMQVEFDYKEIKDARIRIAASESLNEEEIKNKIIEVLQ